MEKYIIEHIASCDACGELLGEDYPEWFLCKKCRQKHGIGEFRPVPGATS
jgi:formylmethanofuran dehydrogenase subunit E